MRETPFMKFLQLAFGGRRDTRAMRNHVAGEAWHGQPVKLPSGDVLLKNPRRVQCGLGTGTSDLIGWHTVTITPEMVGRRVALFLAIEVKARSGKLSPEQIAFLRCVNAAGGIALALREGQEPETLEELTKHLF
jgi:hypothetical protein